jgi:hypothetical protein
MGEPRDIYTKACCDVASAFESVGFRWRKSRHDIVKIEGDLTFSVWFQSSFRNALLGESADPVVTSSVPSKSELFVPLELALAEIRTFGSVSFMAHVGVHAASMKKWRATLANPIRNDDGVAGTNLGHLAANAPRWLDVNLANPRARTGRIAAMIDLITTSAFPYFDRFRHPSEVVASLLDRSDPGMTDDMELEYAVCYGATQDGLKVLERYLKRWPECIEEYQGSLRKYRECGIPSALPGRPGPRLARMAMALGIQK